MKKCLLVVILICIVPLALAADIEEEVLTTLDSEEEVAVIVFLKEETISDFGSLSVEENKEELPEAMAAIEEIQEEVLDNIPQNFELEHQYDTIPALAGEADEQTIEALENDPNVERVVLDRTFGISLNNSTRIINSTLANNLTFDYKFNVTGTDVTVCVIDTGIDYNHTDLGGGLGNRVLAGYDFVNDDTDAMDDNGHGTHVAGIIASSNETYTGVAPNVDLIAMKACNAAGDCTGSDILAAIDWCNANVSVFNISVISMSLGDKAQYTSANCPTTFDASINTSFNLGIVSTIASGNENFNAGISYPACSPNAISVGATDKSDGVTSYSNTGSLLDILAPGGVSGGQITATNLNAGTTNKFGTSMATPHAAGAAALLFEFGRRELGRNLTPTEILNTLKATGVNLTDAGSGLDFPRINVHAAIISLDNVTPNASYVSPTPANNSKVQTDVTIMINVSERLQNVTVFFNGTPSTMALNSTDVLYSLNIGGLKTANYTFYVNGTDFAGNGFSLGNLTIEANNTAPSITSFTPNASQVNTSENQTTVFNQTATDAENHTLTYFWFVNSSLQSQNSSFNYTPGFNDSGLRNITLVVSDGFLNSSNEWNVSVTDVNRPPVASISSPASNTTIEFGAAQSFSSNASDPDGNNITFVWIFGDGNTSTAANVSNTYNATGNYTVILNVSDGNVTVNDSINVSVTDTTAPTLSVTDNGTIIVGENLSVVANATDLSSILNVSFFFNSTVTNMTPSSSLYNLTLENIGNGTYSFSVLAYDEFSNVRNVTDTFTVTYCGDAICNATIGETCSVCSADCGSCPAADSGSSSGGGGGGGGGGGASTIATSTTQAIVTGSKTSVYGNALPGNSYTMDLRDDTTIPLSEISFIPSQLIPTLTLSVFRFDTNPTTKELAHVFSFLEISSEGTTTSSFSSASFDFSVEKSWLTANNLDPETVKLERFVNEQWTALPTRKQLELENTFTYKATSPGFSFFAIRADPLPALEEAPAQVPDATGFSVSDTTSEEAEVVVETPKPVVKKTLLNMIIGVIVLTVGALLLWQFNQPHPHKRVKKGSLKPKRKPMKVNIKQERDITPDRSSGYYHKYYHFFSSHYDTIDQSGSKESSKVTKTDMENSSSGTVRKNS